MDRKVDTRQSDFLVLLDWMTKSRTVLKLRWAVSVEHTRVARVIPGSIHKGLSRLGKSIIVSVTKSIDMTRSMSSWSTNPSFWSIVARYNV